MSRSPRAWRTALLQGGRAAGEAVLGTLDGPAGPVQVGAVQQLGGLVELGEDGPLGAGGRGGPLAVEPREEGPLGTGGRGGPLPVEPRDESPLGTGGHGSPLAELVLQPQPAHGRCQHQHQSCRHERRVTPPPTLHPPRQRLAVRRHRLVGEPALHVGRQAARGRITQFASLGHGLEANRLQRPRHGGNRARADRLFRHDLAQHLLRAGARNGAAPVRIS